MHIVFEQVSCRKFRYLNNNYKDDKILKKVRRTTIYNMHSFTVCVSELFLTFREKEVGVLHSEFGMDYDSVIRSVIESEVKNAAVTYSVDQFRLQRSVLEKYFHRRLKNRLEGIKNTTSLCTS